MDDNHRASKTTGLYQNNKALKSTKPHCGALKAEKHNGTINGHQEAIRTTTKPHATSEFSGYVRRVQGLQMFSGQPGVALLHQGLLKIIRGTQN